MWDKANMEEAESKRAIIKIASNTFFPDILHLLRA
jgi:hypothetical protein